MGKSELSLSLAMGMIEPVPVVLLTTELKGQPNVSTCSRILPVGPAPPTLAISLGADSLTRRAIEETGEFIVNIPGLRLLPAVAFCRRVSGRDVRKHRECGLRLEPGGRLRLPVLTDGIGHLECEAREARAVAGRVLILAEVILAVVRPDLYHPGSGWNLEDPEARLVFHLAEDRYAVAERILEAPGGRPGGRVDLR